MKATLSVLLFHVALVLANQPLQLKVVNSEDDVKLDKLRYQVSLQYQPNKNPSIPYFNGCGGSIISPNWILTAAHCVSNTSIVFKVVAGVNRLSESDNKGQQRNISKTIIHKDYKHETHPNDIALLQLDKPLNLNSLVQTISLPKTGATFTGEVIAAGWGSISATKRLRPDNLKSAVFDLMPIRQCKDVIKNVTFEYKFDDKLNICTGAYLGDSGMCSGDMGGPITQNSEHRVIIGIASWTTKCESHHVSAVVYTNVASFIPFITEHVKDLPK